MICLERVELVVEMDAWLDVDESESCRKGRVVIDGSLSIAILFSV